MAAEIILTNGKVYYSGRDGAFEGEYYGNCPVQGIGTVQRPEDETPWNWYFRARGDFWTLDVGRADDTDFVSEDLAIWSTSDTYGKWPEAGWMPSEDVDRILSQHLHAFLKSDV